MKEIVIILGRNENLKIKLDGFERMELDTVSNTSKFDIKYLRNIPETIKSLKFKVMSYQNQKTIVFIEEFNYESKNNPELITFILSTLLFKDTEKDKAVDSIATQLKHVLFVCHDAHYGLDVETEKLITGDEIEKFHNRVNYLFNNRIENIDIITFFHADRSKIFKGLKEKKPDDGINIKYLIELVDTRFLDTKKKLITTFLPLAIDMQGLYNIRDKEKKELCIKEIIKDIKSGGDRIVNEWEEIKKVLGIGGNKGLLTGKYQLTNEEIEILKFPLETHTGNRFTKKDLKEFFKKDSWTDEEFLPNWLEKAVKILDKKIEANNNE